MGDIPREVLFHILKQFPAQTLVCLKRVCKSWHELINDEQFVKSHLEHWRSLKNSIINIPYVDIERDVGPHPWMWYASLSFADGRDMRYSRFGNLLHDSLNANGSIVLHSWDGMLLLSVVCSHNDRELRMMVCNPVTGSRSSCLVPPTESSSDFIWRITGDGSLQPYTIVGIQRKHSKERSDCTFRCLYFDLHQRESTGWKELSIDMPRHCFVTTPNVVSMGRKMRCVVISSGPRDEKEYLLSLDFETETLVLTNIITPPGLKPSRICCHLSSNTTICFGMFFQRDYEIWAVEDFENPVWRKRHFVGKHPARYDDRPVYNSWLEIYLEEAGKYIVIIDSKHEVCVYDFISKEWTRSIYESNPSLDSTMVDVFSHYVSSLVRCD